jgi:hypothetical protein
MLLAEAGLRRNLARLIPALPLLVGLAAFARAVSVPSNLLNDPDTYLHIAAGRWLLTHAALPSQDPFSHSMAGAPWVVHEWLAEGVLALVYNGLGWPGVVLATAACFAASVALLTHRLLARLSPMLATLAAASGAVMVLPHLLARPHILALPLLVLWSAAIIDARDKGGAPPFRALPLMTLWANLHGGFMVGVALAALAATEATLSRRREAARWGLFLLLAILASMLTPNGLAGFLLPFRILGMSGLQNNFDEWLSPNFHNFQPLEAWLLGLMLLGFLLGLKLPLPRLLLLLGLVHLALHQARQGELLGIVGPLAIAAALGRQLPVSGEMASGRVREAAAAPAVASAVGAIMAVALALGVMTLLRPLTRGDDQISPVNALAAARVMGLSGPVLNSEPFGGYLVFSGVPTFIDGRMEMYGDRFLRRYLDAEQGSEPALAGVIRDYAITWTLLEPHSPAVATLDHLPGWRRVYADAYAVIHARTADNTR